jgi:RNA polymerase sigma-70 factor (ECF subfamily)
MSRKRGEDVDRDPPSNVHDGPTAADFAQIRSKLVISVRRTCPRWLADRAEDIVQDAMIRILDWHKKNEDSDGPSSSYLWKVAYSATVDEIRRARRRRENPVDMEILEKQGPRDEHGPLQVAVDDDLARALGRCLLRLRDNRRLIVGFHLLGHTLAESAELSGWDGKKVQNLLYRGLADLRQCLSAKGFRS